MPFEFFKQDAARTAVRLLITVLVVGWFVAGLGYLGLRHWVWPRLDDWRPQLVEQISRVVGRPVRVDRIETGFEGLLPRVTLRALRVAGPDGLVALEADSLTAVLSPRTLLAGAPRLALLHLDRPRFRLARDAAGHWSVAGFDLSAAQPDGGLVAHLLDQRSILVEGASIDWQDAGQPLRRLQGVDGSLTGVGRKHRAAIRAPLVDGIWRKASLAIEFHRPAAGAAGLWQDWRGEFHVAVDDFDLRGIAPSFRLPGLTPVGGRGDLLVWGDFDRGALRNARLKVAARALDLTLPGGGLRVAAVDLDASRTPGDSGSDIRIQRLDLRLDDGTRFSASGEQWLQLDRDARPVAARLSMAPFDLVQGLALMRPMLSATARRRLDAVDLRGRITALHLQWPAAGGGPEVAVDFQRLGLRAALDDTPLPWFEGLSGQARIRSDGGELRVDAGASTLGFPGLLAEPVIALRALKTSARWQWPVASDDAGWRIDVAELRFANADAEGVVSGSWRSGPHPAGIVDLSGRLSRADATRVARYLPLGIPASVRDWVGGAIQAGRADDVRFRLRGDLADFPFRRPEQGAFQVHARLRDTTLRYAPGWPAIERFDGDLEFDRAGMRVGMRSGRVFDVALGHTEARLADFHDPVLQIEGAGEGAAADMIRFVNQSPVGTRIDDFTRDTVAQGQARLDLRLRLPLTQMARATVWGRVGFLGNDLKLDKTVPLLSGTRGALEFDEHGLALKGLTAGFLGGSVRVDGETTAPGRFRLRAEGSLPAEGMRAVSDNPLTRRLSGQVDWRASIEVLRRAATLVVESDLRGLSAELPAPFTKAAADAWPVRVRVDADAAADPAARSPRDRIRVDLRDDVRIAIERERDPASENLRIRRAAFAMRAEPVLPPQGLSIALDAGLVDVDAWLALLTPSDLSSVAQPAADGFTEGFSLLPNLLSVRADHIRVAGKTLDAVDLRANRVADQWQATIAARQVSGRFAWRDAAPGHRIGTFSARLDRLEIPRARADELTALLDRPPRELPGLDIAADEFVLFGRRLGRLDLRATNTAGNDGAAWVLDQLRIVHPAATLRAHGGWRPAAEGQPRATRLDFTLDLNDSGRMLALFGVPGAVRDAAGKLAGSLSWNGSPLAIDYPSLAGEMSLALGRGQFLKTEPGIAKLIGVLNLQSLPRRLSLDFRDVFAEGFAFDDITGEVRIDAGVARTEALAMRGPQARVRIRGSADIAAETQVLDVEVRPEFNAGLASVAYGAIVNPLIGLGSYVAQLALSRPIREILSYDYEITGAWADPRVIERRRMPDASR